MKLAICPSCHKQRVLVQHGRRLLFRQHDAVLPDNTRKTRCPGSHTSPPAHATTLEA